MKAVGDLSDRAALEKTGVVVIGNAWGDFTTQEISSLIGFVNNGGGLLAAGLGWSWQDYGPAGQPNPPPGQPIEKYPMNQLFNSFGATWTGALVR